MPFNASDVTWLMPVKNGMPYIKETLRSVREQSVSGAKLYAWDNGSDDGTREVLNEWIPAKIDGKIFLNEPLTLGNSLRRLVFEAKTTLVARIDADDVCLPNRLEKQLQFINSSPNIVAVGGQVTRIDEDGNDGGLYYGLPITHEQIVLRMLRKWAIWHPTMLLKKDVVVQAGCYLDERPVEDYSLWLRLARIGRIGNLQDVVLKYRVHSVSVTENAKKEGVLDGYIKDCVLKYGVETYGLSVRRLAEIYSGGRLSLEELGRMRRSMAFRSSSTLSILIAAYKEELLGEKVSKCLGLLRAGFITTQRKLFEIRQFGV